MQWYYKEIEIQGNDNSKKEMQGKDENEKKMQYSVRFSDRWDKDKGKKQFRK